MKGLSRFLSILAACVFVSAAASARADPPGRVGRISLLDGAVFLYNDQYGESQDARLNWPVTTGDTLSAAPGSRAEVRIGSTAIRLDGDSELEFAVLDDRRLQLRLMRGTVSARIRDPEQARQFTLGTPAGSVALHDVGAYRFEAERRPYTTVVTVFQGTAAFAGERLSLSIRTGQRAEVFDGRQGQDYAMTAAIADDFDAWSQARDRRDDEARSVRYVSREMTGYEDLDGYGDWRVTAEYGPVWHPHHVAVGWAPYRSGYWAWVEPWGWTWVDDAPWGFAPFHYGRWVFIGGIWGWVPGPLIARPIYAPALVVWVGSPGWQLSFSFGTGPAVGWFPLGPREVYVPAFRSSTVFVQRINAPHVTDVARIANVQREPHRVNYVNRAHPGALTIVPTQVVSGGQHVSRNALRTTQAQSIGALPAPVSAPVIAPPRRRERAAVPAPAPSRAPREQAAPPAGSAAAGANRGAVPAEREPRSVVPPRPAATPGTDGEDARRAIRRRDAEPARPPQRSPDSAPAAPREPRVFVAPRSAAPAAVPGEARRSPAPIREVERAAPQSRSREPAAPAAAPPARSEREVQRPAVILRPPAPAPLQGAAPAPRRGAAGEAAPPPRATEMPRSEARGAAAREPRNGGRDNLPAQREAGRDARPVPGNAR